MSDGANSRLADKVVDGAAFCIIGVACIACIAGVVWGWSEPGRAGTAGGMLLT